MLDENCKSLKTRMERKNCGRKEGKGRERKCAASDDRAIKDDYDGIEDRLANALLEIEIKGSIR